jgi:hypothetical protein
MSKRDLTIVLCFDAMVLCVWLLGTFKSLTPLQVGLGIGLPFVFNLVFISKRSGIRLFVPQKPLSIGATSNKDSRGAAPQLQNDPVNPGFTLLRILAGFLCIPTLGQLFFVASDLQQGNTYDALRCLVRFLIGTYMIFWLFKVTKKAPASS